MRDSVLYYPHIEIQSPRWLKTALLLWDHVYRIAPRNYAPFDNDETKHATGADLVRSVRLETPDLQEIVTDFRCFMDRLPFTPDGLLKDHDDVALLHPDKVDSTLYPLLDQYAKGGQKGGWIELPSEIVRGYMFFLSAKVAERRCLERATDDGYSFAISSYFSEDANFSGYVYDPESEGFYASLIFEDVLPVNVDEIPMKEIVRIAQSSKDERTEFRQQLSLFSTELHKSVSKEHAEVVLNDCKNDLLAARDRLKASQGFLGEHERGSLLAVGIPVAIGTFGTLIGAGTHPFGLYTLSSSLLIGAIASYADYKRAKAAADNPCGASYLVSLEKQFSGKNTYPAFSRYMEEFLND